MSYTTNTWSTSSLYSGYWPDTITSGTSYTSGVPSSISIGTNMYGNVNPWGETDLDYKIGRDRYSYAERDDMIKVDKGSPSKSKYVIFYAVNKDPVIFCRTRKEMIKEVKRLLKRKEVDYKSIRIFKLVGGAKEIKRHE